MKMKSASILPAAALLSTILCSHSAVALEPAKDWQIKSLKGIASIQFAMASDDPSGKWTETLKTGIAGLNVPSKQVTFPAKITLGTTDALVKVAVDKRKNHQNWVGLYVHQKSKLDRDPSISYEAETYGIGALVPNGKVGATIKELMSQFDSDFKGAQ